LNLLGEKNYLLVFPKGTLKEFSGDGTIDAKRHLHLFLDVCDFHGKVIFANLIGKSI
jgi:hypothetical protein